MPDAGSASAGIAGSAWSAGMIANCDAKTAIPTNKFRMLPTPVIDLFGVTNSMSDNNNNQEIRIIRI